MSENNEHEHSSGSFTTASTETGPMTGRITLSSLWNLIDHPESLTAEQLAQRIEIGVPEPMERPPSPMSIPPSSESSTCPCGIGPPHSRGPSPPHSMRNSSRPPTYEQSEERRRGLTEMSSTTFPFSPDTVNIEIGSISIDGINLEDIRVSIPTSVITSSINRHTSTINTATVERVMRMFLESFGSSSR